MFRILLVALAVLMMAAGVWAVPELGFNKSQTVNYFSSGMNENSLLTFTTDEPVSRFTFDLTAEGSSYGGMKHEYLAPTSPIQGTVTNGHGDFTATTPFVGTYDGFGMTYRVTGPGQITVRITNFTAYGPDGQLIETARVTVLTKVSTFKPPIPYSDRIWEGDLVMVGTNGSMLYLQSKDRSQAFEYYPPGYNYGEALMIFLGTNGVHARVLITDCYPRRSVASLMTFSGLTEEYVSKPVFMKIGDIWDSFNADPYTTDARKSYFRYSVMVIGRLDKTNPDRPFLYDRNRQKYIIVTQLSPAEQSQLPNGCLMKAWGTLGHIYDDVTGEFHPYLRTQSDMQWWWEPRPQIAEGWQLLASPL